jgi:hypothetical protein
MRKIVVEVATVEEERRAAHRLVAEMYVEAGYIPTVESLEEMAPIIITAKYEEGELVGSIGIYTDGGNPFPVEYFFDIPPVSMIFGASRDRFLEIARLARPRRYARDKRVLPALCFACYQVALLIGGIEYIVASLAPVVHRYVRAELGLPIVAYDAPVRVKRIPERYRGYFLAPRAKPQVMTLSIGSASPIMELFRIKMARMNIENAITKVPEPIYTTSLLPGRAEENLIMR